LYDEKSLEPADLYQSFVYAFALGCRPDHRWPASLILYPATAEPAEPLRLRVASADGRHAAEVRAMGIAIPQALDEIESATIGQCGTTIRAAIVDMLQTTLLWLGPSRRFRFGQRR
ncbi:MAG: hypothetical protein ACRDHY_01345, partial [Anaerolineales bacterium]